MRRYYEPLYCKPQVTTKPNPNLSNLLSKLTDSISFYKAISLYEFYLNVIFIVLIASTQNTFLAVLFAGLLSKHIPERLIKTFLSKKDGKLTSLAMRPKGANNCNMFNAGGVTTTSGLVSGHIFLITTLTFYFIYRFTNNFKQAPNPKQNTLISLLLLCCVMVATARVKLNCHQPHQVAIGFVLGVGWGYLLYFTIEKVKELSPRVKEDEEKMLKLLNV
jgi:membrane-associated phospholipid phosphatase